MTFKTLGLRSLCLLRGFSMLVGHRLEPCDESPLVEFGLFSVFSEPGVNLIDDFGMIDALGSIVDLPGFGMF